MSSSRDNRDESAGRRLSAALRVAGTGLVVLLIGSAFHLLMQEPVLGAADNLDFERVMRPAGIQHTQDVTSFHHQYVVTKFKLVPSNLLHKTSSAVMPAWLARHLRFLFGAEPGHMDIRQVGLVYLLVLTALLLRALRLGVPPLLCALATWVIVDPGYCLYFNSFFADAAFLVGAFGVYLWLIRWGGFEGRDVPWLRKGWTLTALFVLLLLAGGSKQLYIYLPAVVALPLLVIAWVPGNSTWRIRLTASAILIVAALLPAAHFSIGSGPRFHWLNGYNRVFMGILMATSRTDETLHELGLRDEFLSLRGTHAWSGDWRELERGDVKKLKRRIRNISTTKVATLYLQDPSAVAFVSQKVKEPLALKVPTDGSFEASDPRKSRRYKSRWQFSNVRARIVKAAWPAIAIGLAVALAAVAYDITRRRRASGIQIAIAVLILAFGVHLAATVIGDGFFALSRHLIGARLYLDLLLVTASYWGASALAARFREKGLFLGIRGLRAGWESSSEADTREQDGGDE
jgi:hypothetical protein